MAENHIVKCSHEKSNHERRSFQIPNHSNLSITDKILIDSCEKSKITDDMISTELMFIAI